MKMNSISRIHQELEKNQQEIIKKIKKSHQLIIAEFIVSVISIVAFVLLQISAGILSGEPRKIIPFVFSPLAIIMIFIINYTRYRPFYNKVNAQFKQIGRIDTITIEADLVNTKLVYGITTYINSLYHLYSIFEQKKEAKEEINDINREDDLKKLFRIRNILDLTMVAIFLIGFVVIISQTILGNVSIPWVYIPFSVIVFLIIISVIISFQARASINEWLSIYKVLDIWGHIIENDEKIEDYNRQLNG